MPAVLSSDQYDNTAPLVRRLDAALLKRIPTWRKNNSWASEEGAGGIAVSSKRPLELSPTRAAPRRTWPCVLPRD